jgi:CRP-like cAMP-binding protein
MNTATVFPASPVLVPRTGVPNPLPHRLIGTRHRIAFWQSSVPHSPKKNQILAALPEADYERVLPHLELIQLPYGSTLNEAGSHPSFVYFPIVGIVSPLYVKKNGAVSAVSITGSEGVVGTSLFMGGGTTLNWDVVQSAGYAYRLSANKLKQEFERGSNLCQMLLRFTQSLITQIAQTAVCTRHHTLKQQLCRWLLLSLDRMPTNELRLTHELLATILGVRREGVTMTAGDLQKAGVIRYSRGHVTVLDRPMLEKCACECYSVVKKGNDHLHEITGFNLN